MSRRIGYIVIEWNQAGGPATVPMASEIEPTQEEARVTKRYYEGVARLSGRRDRYEVATIELPEEGEDD